MLPMLSALTPCVACDVLSALTPCVACDVHSALTPCVACDVHTIAPWPLEPTCQRQFAMQWEDCKKNSNCTGKNLKLHLSMWSLLLSLSLLTVCLLLDCLRPRTMSHTLIQLSIHSYSQARTHAVQAHTYTHPYKVTPIQSSTHNPYSQAHTHTKSHPYSQAHTPIQ